jgi:DNA-binding MarR family transcriptional regulator
VEDSLSREVYRLLRMTTNHLKNDLRYKIEQNGITWQQFHALYHIDEQGVPSNELAKELSCNASNMTGLIDRMIESNWVYRERSSEDRRVWMVKLTEEGSKLKTTLLPQHQHNINQTMSILNKEELLSLKDILLKLMNGSNGEEQRDE